MAGLNFKLAVIILLAAPAYLLPQNFGFGCLGFPGGFGGYSFQKYKPTGLNDYIEVFNLNRKDSLRNQLNDFGQAAGYRVGINFFRKKFSKVFITGKGFYQSISEKHQAVEQLHSGEKTTSYEVKLTNWGVGIDLGIPLISILNWKIIDAAITYNKARFSASQNFPSAVTIVQNYESNFELGYSVGTGIIIEILGEYITLESSAAYSKFSIGEMKMSDNTFLSKNENSSDAMKSFINDGGFNAVIQLNIGIPL